jgi:hypothetical protein
LVSSCTQSIAGKQRDGLGLGVVGNTTSDLIWGV